MSADDFQTQYASFMDGMLKSAVAETTKLFETMVDELKAEISRIKKENEDLKTKCSQYESAKSQTAADTRDNISVSGPNDGSEKRDSAVQCDLVPFRTVLVEQCQSLQNQGQQYTYEQMQYHLQEHNYIAHGIKQEESYSDCSLWSVCKQEDVEPAVVYGQAGSLQASAENEGPVVTQGSSTEDEETRVLEQMSSRLQGVQNQSTDPEPALVTSLAAIKDTIQEVSEFDQTTSEKGTQEELTISGKHQSVPQQCHRDCETSVNEQTDVAVQQYADVHRTEKQLAESTHGELKHGVAESDALSKPNLPVRSRRGRPPKKTKPQTILSSSADVSGEQKGLNSPSVREEVVFSQAFPVQPEETSSIITPPANSALENMDNREVASLPASVGIQAPSTVVLSTNETPNSPPAESPQAPPGGLKDCRTSVTLQDAMLLVEAMNQSTVENTVTTASGMEQPETCSVPRGAALQIVDKVPVKPQQSPPVETRHTTDTISPSETQAHIAVVMPKQKHAPVPFSITMSPMSQPTAAPKSTALLFPRPSISLVAPSKPNKAVPHAILIMPKSRSSFMSQKIAAVSPTQISTIASAAQQNSSTVVGLPLKTSSHSSVLQAVNITSRKFLPNVPSQSTANSADLHSGTLPQSKILIIPTRLSAMASRKHQSQATVLTVKQKSAEAAAPVTESSTQLIFMSQELDVSASRQPVLSQKMDDTTDSIKTSKQTASSLKMSDEQVPASVFSVLPPAVEKEVTAVVRLTRLPFPVSTKESVLVSRLLSKGSCDGITQEKPSRPTVSFSEVPVLSSSICSHLTETSVAVSTNTSQMADESNNIQVAWSSETPSLSVEMSSNEVQDKQAAAQLQLSSSTSKDTPDLPSPAAKTQLLTQLAESPTVQVTTKATSDDFAEARVVFTDTNTCKKSLQKDSLIARLQSHLKSHSKARRTEAKPEAHTERDTSTVSAKRPRLENGCLNDENTTREHSPISFEKADAFNNTTCLDQITSTSSSSSQRRTEPAYGGCRRSKPTSASTKVSPSSGRDGLCSKNTKSTWRRSCDSTKESTRSESTKSCSTFTKRLTREGATPKKTESASVNPRTPSYSKNGANLTVSAGRTTFPIDSPGIKQIKKEFSSPFRSRRCSIKTDSTKKTNSETVFQSIKGPEMAKTPRRSFKILNSVKLAKAAKAKTIAKMRNSNQSKLQKHQLTENQATCEVVKKCRAKVWIPPVVPADEMPPAGEKRSSLSHVNTEAKPNNQTFVNPLIPVRTSPIVSPLQPLAVIGRHLLRNQCGECGRILSSSAALESHVSLHTGRRPFSCTLCGKSFPDAKSFKRHGRVHRNGRIHICQHCGKGFVYRFGLTKHLQMVHSKIKPFICQVCNKGFFTKRDVEVHVRIHTGEKPFHCNHCDKKFTRRVELNVHLRWHNGEKRHWCPYCGKGFLDFNNLKRHKYIHTGEKPHSCPHCPKQFTQSGHLKKHVKNVHKAQ
ncbi:probable GPI-anchored adhesin-like protein PGA55 [Stegastes partitus]|uniref:Probable GPI-anchored adhesin-like protein PGA55 n=1 Tax=Stegastes partitus TaxID=144197 RepID=A0A3B5A840_9TELE|nr:PREDICTED: probable GPI-anchored adhesin-like protein PGA55 [Stegastes partitus]